ncbi:ferric iron reductase [Pseudobdellovibrio exovorus]|uniref:Aerobactin siderophore biosynthesis IucA/IucC-like C-terminal domain-containing protein n=1 Tax=Pseudobdellovibrio exovorus JSS TaxID=1184267 RepID=M4VFH6_9BACT|nr:IucA/IucC family C-terminal-domain containing protein [Pseudobdellovibrio exovorus]AGH96806.1 hypothetical protein A11Q_2590 [Pseudobdellovibrio exovorus JSS]
MKNVRQQAELKKQIAKTFVMAQQELNSMSSRSVALNDFQNDVTGARVQKNSFVENGFLPLKKTLAAQKGLHGKTPYWQLTPQRLKHPAVSSVVDNPFPYLSAHLWDRSALRLLEKTFGPADGFLTQEVLVNLRTICAFAEDAPRGSNKGVFCDPTLLKFSHYQKDEARDLSPAVRKGIFLANIEMSHLLKDNPVFLNEHSGTTFDLPDENTFFYQLQRQLPFEQMQLDGQDLYLPIFAIYSQQLRQTALEKLIFGATVSSAQSSTDYLAWFKQNVARPLMRVIFDSFFKYGIHFELHQQNLTVLLRQAQTESLFVQDFYDVLEDPVAQALLKPFDAEAIVTRQRAPLGLCNEMGFASDEQGPKSLLAIGSWYRLFLRDFGQHEKCVRDGFLSFCKGNSQDGDSIPTLSFNDIFSEGIAEELKKFTQQHQIDFDLSTFREHDIVIDSTADFYARLTALRELICFSLLKKLSLSEATSSLAGASGENALDRFYQTLRDGHGILLSYGSVVPENQDELRLGWNSWLLSPHPRLQVLFQTDKDNPRKARYFAALFPRQPSAFYLEYFKAVNSIS